AHAAATTRRPAATGTATGAHGAGPAAMGRRLRPPHRKADLTAINMEFTNNEAIYLQIAGYVGDNILRQQWPPDGKIPSVRDLAAELQVNPNTVMRTYDFLQNQGTVYNK
nr:hypothetical protein [Tanacetum cinerariifolium]